LTQQPQLRRNKLSRRGSTRVLHAQYRCAYVIESDVIRVCFLDSSKKTTQHAAVAALADMHIKHMYIAVILHASS